METSGEQVQPLHIPSSPWANSYASEYTTPDSGRLTAEEVKLLQHVNCSYLSSGTPPTLLALKQHAHSLVNLINKLAPTTKGAPIAHLDEDEDGYAFYPGDAFDWLSSLNTPYNSDSDSHHVPLWGIHNTVCAESEEKGLQHHCPLTEVANSGPWAEKDGKRKPYQTHHQLAMHANECLEILDHEYSATGGLMSLLPPGVDNEETAQHAGVRNSLLGQWLSHHQHLVLRMHELEISYANALDALAGEAVVPYQIVRHSGPDGVSRGREIAYPQDRWILCNVGDDVSSHIHAMLDKAEASYTEKHKIWKKAGVSGERIWHEERGGNWYAKGIIPVDLMTRYYRIAGKGHQSPLFVLPAINHPGVSETRKMEERPTIFTIVAPSFPERVSELEKKYRHKDAEILQLRNKLKLWEEKVPGGEVGRQRALLEKVAEYEKRTERAKKFIPKIYHAFL
ncbi:hypothetical protein B0T10DRAFT_486304 [Thelonectria olida]|uniref:Uncharacterized protein n=1 Tax=Thelonectria olida TaxID=1576542 RepID=A0A9P9AMR4_9HYPO|nr:hypothetical protein B0T10DRAFT_486304 [Thelonectria olida]